MTLLIAAKPNWKQVGGSRGVPGATWYTWGDLQVCVGDPVIEGGHHISISHPYRYPTWDEIKAARYDLLPDDVTMAMLLPPIRQYVNRHDYCFHLHQIPNEPD
jgi:hypothetical protein